jgi:hypothetical protein
LKFPHSDVAQNFVELRSEGPHDNNENFNDNFEARKVRKTYSIVFLHGTRATAEEPENPAFMPGSMLRGDAGGYDFPD